MRTTDRVTTASLVPNPSFCPCLYRSLTLPWQIVHCTGPGGPPSLNHKLWPCRPCHCGEHRRQPRCRPWLLQVVAAAPSSPIAVTSSDEGAVAPSGEGAAPASGAPHRHGGGPQHSHLWYGGAPEGGAAGKEAPSEGSRQAMQAEA